MVRVGEATASREPAPAFLRCVVPRVNVRGEHVDGPLRSRAVEVDVYRDERA